MLTKKVTNEERLFQSAALQNGIFYFAIFLETVPDILRN